MTPAQMLDGCSVNTITHLKVVEWMIAKTHKYFLVYKWYVNSLFMWFTDTSHHVLFVKIKKKAIGYLWPATVNKKHSFLIVSREMQVQVNTETKFTPDLSQGCAHF